MGYVWAVITFFNNLMTALKAIKDAIAAAHEKKRQDRKQARDAAVDELSKAKTKEEFERAQDAINDNLP